MSERNYSPRTGLFTRVVAVIVLLAFTLTSTFGQNIDLLSASENSMLERYYQRANASRDRAEWQQLASFGVQTVIATWEQRAGATTPPEELAELRSSLSSAIEGETREQYTEWLVQQFFRQQATDNGAGFYDAIKQANDSYLFVLNPDGSYASDSNGNLMYRKTEAFEEDFAAWKALVADGVEAAVQGLNSARDQAFQDLVSFVGLEPLADAALPELFATSFQAYVDRVTAGLEHQYAFQERRFYNLRTYDQYSLKKKTDNESAAAVAAQLISDAQLRLQNGLASLQSGLAGVSDEGAAEVGEIEAEAWRQEFRAAFDQGMKTWDQAEEALLAKRIEWENRAIQSFEDGEKAWAEAYQQIQKQRESWQQQLREIIQDGEQKWSQQELELGKALADAREELERGILQRKQNLESQITGVIDILMQSADVLRSAESSLAYWNDQEKKYADDKTSDQNVLERIVESKTFWEGVMKTYKEYMEQAEEKLAAVYGVILADDVKYFISEGNPVLDAFEGIEGDDLLGSFSDGEWQYRYLDAYQVRLIRAQILDEYWQNEVRIAQAVFDYARDVSSERQDEADTLDQLNSATANYQAAQEAYNQKLGELRAAGDELAQSQQALVAIQNELANKQADLEQARAAYQKSFDSLMALNPAAYRKQIREFYDQLSAAIGAGSSDESVEETTFIDYLNALGPKLRGGVFAQLNDRLSQILEGNQYEASLSELKDQYDKASAWSPALGDPGYGEFGLSAGDYLAGLMIQEGQWLDSHTSEAADKILGQARFQALGSTAGSSIRSSYIAKLDEARFLAAKSLEQWEQSLVGNDYFAYLTNLDGIVYGDLAELSGSIQDRMDYLGATADGRYLFAQAYIGSAVSDSVLRAAELLGQVFADYEGDTEEFLQTYDWDSLQASISSWYPALDASQRSVVLALLIDRVSANNFNMATVSQEFAAWKSSFEAVLAYFADDTGALRAERLTAEGLDGLRNVTGPHELEAFLSGHSPFSVSARSSWLPEDGSIQASQTVVALDQLLFGAYGEASLRHKSLQAVVAQYKDSHPEFVIQRRAENRAALAQSLLSYGLLTSTDGEDWEWAQASGLYQKFGATDRPEAEFDLWLSEVNLEVSQKAQALGGATETLVSEALQTATSFAILSAWKDGLAVTSDLLDGNGNPSQAHFQSLDEQAARASQLYQTLVSLSYQNLQPSQQAGTLLQLFSLSSADLEMADVKDVLAQAASELVASEVAVVAIQNLDPATLANGVSASTVQTSLGLLAQQNGWSLGELESEIVSSTVKLLDTASLVQRVLGGLSLTGAYGSLDTDAADKIRRQAIWNQFSGEAASFQLLASALELSSIRRVMEVLSQNWEGELDVQTALDTVAELWDIDSPVLFDILAFGAEDLADYLDSTLVPADIPVPTAILGLPSAQKQADFITTTVFLSALSQWLSGKNESDARGGLASWLATYISESGIEDAQLQGSFDSIAQTLVDQLFEVDLEAPDQELLSGAVAARLDALSAELFSSLSPAENQFDVLAKASLIQKLVSTSEAAASFVTQSLLDSIARVLGSLGGPSAVLASGMPSGTVTEDQIASWYQAVLNTLPQDLDLKAIESEEALSYAVRLKLLSHALSLAADGGQPSAQSINAAFASFLSDELSIDFYQDFSSDLYFASSFIGLSNEQSISSISEYLGLSGELANLFAEAATYDQGYLATLAMGASVKNLLRYSGLDSEEAAELVQWAFDLSGLAGIGSLPDVEGITGQTSALRLMALSALTEGQAVYVAELLARLGDSAYEQAAVLLDANQKNKITRLYELASSAGLYRGSIDGSQTDYALATFADTADQIALAKLLASGDEGAGFSALRDGDLFYLSSVLEARRSGAPSLYRILAPKAGELAQFRAQAVKAQQVRASYQVQFASFQKRSDELSFGYRAYLTKQNVDPDGRNVPVAYVDELLLDVDGEEGFTVAEIAKKKAESGLELSDEEVTIQRLYLNEAFELAARFQRQTARVSAALLAEAAGLSDSVDAEDTFYELYAGLFAANPATEVVDTSRFLSEIEDFEVRAYQTERDWMNERRRIAYLQSEIERLGQVVDLIERTSLEEREDELEQKKQEMDTAQAALGQVQSQWQAAIETFKARQDSYSDAFKNVEDSDAQLKLAKNDYRVAEAVYEYASTSYLRDGLDGVETTQNLPVDPSSKLLAVKSQALVAKASFDALKAVYTGKPATEVDEQYEAAFAEYESNYRKAMYLEKLQALFETAVGTQQQKVDDLQAELEANINDKLLSGKSMTSPQNFSQIDLRDGVELALMGLEFSENGLPTLLTSATYFGSITEGTAEHPKGLIVRFDLETHTFTHKTYRNLFFYYGGTVEDLVTLYEADEEYAKQEWQAYIEESGSSEENVRTYSKDQEEWADGMSALAADLSDKELEQKLRTWSYAYSYYKNLVLPEQNHKYWKSFEKTTEDFVSTSDGDFGYVEREIDSYDEYMPALIQEAWDSVHANPEELELFNYYLMNAQMGTTIKVAQGFNFFNDEVAREVKQYVSDLVKQKADKLSKSASTIGIAAFAAYASGIALMSFPFTIPAGLALLAQAAALGLAAAGLAEGAKIARTALSSYAAPLQSQTASIQYSLDLAIDGIRKNKEVRADLSEATSILNGLLYGGGTQSSSVSFGRLKNSLGVVMSITGTSLRDYLGITDKEFVLPENTSENEAIISYLFDNYEPETGDANSPLSLLSAYTSEAVKARNEAELDMNARIGELRAEQAASASSFDADAASLAEFTAGLSLDEDGNLVGEGKLAAENTAHYKEIYDRLLDQAEAAYGPSAFVIRSHQRRLVELDLAMAKRLDRGLPAGMTDRYAQQLSVIAQRLTGMYSDRLTALATIKEAQWAQATKEFSSSRALWNQTIRMINIRGAAEWQRADRRLASSRQAWIQSFEDSFAQQSAAWDLQYGEFLQKKADWVEDLAVKTSLAGNRDVLGQIAQSAAEQSAASVEASTIEALSEWKAEAVDTSAILQSITGGVFSKMLESAKGANSRIGAVKLQVNGLLGSDALSKTGVLQLIRDFKSESSEELEHELMLIAAQKAIESILAAREGHLQSIASANEGTRNSLERTFIDAGWKITGSEYQKRILTDSTALGGDQYRDAAIKAFKSFVVPKEITFLPEFDLDVETFSKLSTNAISERVDAAMAKLKEDVDKVFGPSEEKSLDEALLPAEKMILKGTEAEWGKQTVTETYIVESETDDGLEKREITRTKVVDVVLKRDVSKRIDVPQGLFDKWIGYAPEFQKITDHEDADSRDDFRKRIKFEGAGEIGRIMFDFTRYNYLEGRGWAEFNKPAYEKRIWDDDGSWLKAPTVRGIVDIGVSIIGNIVAPGFGALIGLIDDFVFTVADVAGGYKSTTDAFGAFAKKAGAAIATTLIGSTGFGDGLSNILGGSVIADALGNVAQQFLTNVATGAINSIEWTEKGLGWNADTFADQTVGLGALASYAGSFASGVFSGGMSEILGNVEAGFVKGAIDIGAGLVSKGAKMLVYGAASGFKDDIGTVFDKAGGLSINIMDLGTMFGMFSEGGIFGRFDAAAIEQMSKVQNALTGTGLNLNFTTKGVTGSFGSGSDIGLMAGLASLYKGLSTRDWAAKTYGANSDTYQSVGKVYTYGDSAALATIARLRKGVDELKVGTSGGTIGAQTTASEDGKRSITINGYGNADSLAVALSHEAHRDGYSPDWGSFTDPDSDEFKQAYGDQAGETYRAVLAHTQLARKLAKDGGAGIFADQIGIQTDLAKLKRAEEVGMAAFAEYVGRAYDSSADYWKLIKHDNGDLELEWDGKKDLYDEDGNLITIVQGAGPQATLARLLGWDTEKQGSIYTHLLNPNGLTWDSEGGTWNADIDDGPIRFNAGNVRDKDLSAELFYGAEGYYPLKEFAEQHPGDVEGIKRDLVSRSIGAKVTSLFLGVFEVDNAYENRVAELNDRLIRFLNNTGSLYDQATLPTQGWGPVEPGESTADLYSFHTGGDRKPEDSETTISILSGLAGRVSRSDGISTAVGNQVQIEHGIMFEGTFISFGFNTGRAHMESRAVSVGNMVGPNTILGVMGNQGTAVVGIPGIHDHLTVFSDKTYGTNLFTSTIFNLDNSDSWENADGTPWVWQYGANRRFYDAPTFYDLLDAGF